MEFKAFFLCFAVFVVITSGATLFEWEADEKKGTTSEYKVEVKDGNKEVNETIKIDTGKKTETVHISSESRGKVDILFDFKQNIAMYRLSKSKACFLSDSTGNQLKPADLKKLLEMPGTSKGKIQGKTEYVVVGTLDDRSFLSDEMAAMCTKLPIYRIKQKNPKVYLGRYRKVIPSVDDISAVISKAVRQPVSSLPNVHCRWTFGARQTIDHVFREAGKMSRDVNMFNCLKERNLPCTVV